MNDSSQAGMLQWDRFTGIWLALVGLLVAAALVTAWIGGASDMNDMMPAYSSGDTVEDFVYNAYLAHLRGDLVRLESMYAADTWAEMSHADKHWGSAGLFASPDLLGMRIRDMQEGPDGLQAMVVHYHTRWGAPLAIQRVEVSTHAIVLTSAADGWKLQRMLPRHWY